MGSYSWINCFVFLPPGFSYTNAISSVYAFHFKHYFSHSFHFFFKFIFIFFIVFLLLFNVPYKILFESILLWSLCNLFFIFEILRQFCFFNFFPELYQFSLHLLPFYYCPILFLVFEFLIIDLICIYYTKKYIYMYIYVYMSVYMCVCIYMFVHIYVCIYICVCVS